MHVFAGALYRSHLMAVSSNGYQQREWTGHGTLSAITLSPSALMSLHNICSLSMCNVAADGLVAHSGRGSNSCHNRANLLQIGIKQVGETVIHLFRLSTCATLSTSAPGIRSHVCAQRRKRGFGAFCSGRSSSRHSTAAAAAAAPQWKKQLRLPPLKILQVPHTSTLHMR